MSWWTQNRKKILPAAGLLGLQFIPGVGQAVSGALGGLLGAGEAGSLATGATAAAVPGLSATGPTSQAAMLAAQNAGMGLTGLAKTAEAAAGAQGLTGGQQMLGQGMGLLGKMGPVMKAAPQLAQAMAPPQQAPMAPPPPPQPPQVQQGPSISPYGGMDSPPPGIDPKLWASLDPMMKRKLMMGG